MIDKTPAGRHHSQIISVAGYQHGAHTDAKAGASHLMIDIQFDTYSEDDLGFEGAYRYMCVYRVCLCACMYRLCDISLTNTHVDAYTHTHVSP